MLTFALTGGIATGKSTAAKLLLELAPGTVLFDSDACVHELLTRREVVASIAASLGQDLASADGTLDRSRLRELVFAQAEHRKTLEGILHPFVRTACTAARQQARDSGTAAIFLADVPLLYESRFPLDRDLDLVVACAPSTQRSRLMARSGFAPDLADQIIAAQLPIMGKMARAGVVLWNGGSPASLRRQTEHFLLWLKNKTFP
jgi:dephospho-CoA kinase